MCCPALVLATRWYLGTQDADCRVGDLVLNVDGIELDGRPLDDVPARLTLTLTLTLILTLTLTLILTLNLTLTTR